MIYRTFQQIQTTLSILFQADQPGYSYYLPSVWYDIYITSGGTVYKGYNLISDNIISDIYFTNDITPYYIQTGLVVNYTPISDSDPLGSSGQIVYDDNYVYLKGLTAWGRTILSTWEVIDFGNTPINFNGSNQFNNTSGTASLASGVVTISNSNVTSNSLIWVQYQSGKPLSIGIGNIGILRVDSQTMGSSFSVVSESLTGSTILTDNSSIQWWIINR